MVEITLEDMQFYAYHGVLEQEQKVGNQFIVSLSLCVEAENSLLSDEVNDTVNYAEVYQVVKDEMSIKSKLLEHLAGRIVKRLFDEFDRVQSIRIKVSKPNPPFYAQLKSVSIQLEKHRAK